MRVVQPGRAQQRPLGRAGGAEHLRAQVPGQLHGGRADAAGGGVDQHGLAGAQRGQADQGVPGGEVDHRRGCRLGQRPPGRDRGQQPGVGHRQRAEGPGEQAHHQVAGAQPGDLGAGLQHHARALKAEQSGVAGVHAEDVQHVPEVHPGRAQADPDLVGRQRSKTGSAGRQHHVLQGAALGPLQPPTVL